MRSLGATSSTYWFWTMERTSVNSRSCSYVAPLSVLLLATVPPKDSVSTTRSELMTNAFFMKPPLTSASLPQPVGRILGLALEAHLEVQARARERAGIPDGADVLCLPHVVTLLHVDVRDMGVQRVVLVAMIHDDQIPVPLEPAGVDHVPSVHGPHLGA